MATHKTVSILIFSLIFSNACTLHLSVRTAAAISPDVVISQVYGGGGNSGATYQNDFIELFNRGAASVNVAGWSVQYASASGSSWLVTTLSGSLQPGQYFLVQQASNGAVGAALPTPDVIGATNLSATNGKVALARVSTPLAGANPLTDTNVVDFIGYGSANAFEGSAAAPALSNTTVAFRATGGCQDTDDNASDFAAGAPAPRNTASAFNLCSTGADADLTIGKTGPTAATTSETIAYNISLSNIGASAATNTTVTDTLPTGFSYVSDSSGVAPTFSGQDVIWNLGAIGALTSTSFRLTVTVASTAGVYTNTIIASTDAIENSTTNNSGSASTTIAPLLRIHDIQGLSHLSPYSGTLVSGIEGIVTAKTSISFFMQDPLPDADPHTSEGIIVFTGGAPSAQIGDFVRVSGRVNEFRPNSGSTRENNLTRTEIGNSPTVQVISSTNPLPAPTVIGAGGRVPPTQVIEDDAIGNVETSGVFDPANDGIDFYENLEGMLVQINTAVVSGPTNDFGETWVLADNGSGAGARTVRGGIVIDANDFNPERIQLDDEVLKVAYPSAPFGVYNVGDTFSNPITGVLEYQFNNFRVQVAAPVSGTAGGLAPEVTTPQAADELSVATFNVENLDPTDPITQFNRLANIVVTNLKSPDVIAVEEIQDNNGPFTDTTVSASQTFTTLISAITSAGGPTYDYRQIDPLPNQDGGEPGGNIRVGFLFRADRGVSFVDRPGGDATTPVSATLGASGVELTLSPGRIDPTNSAFNNSRKPLAGEFLFRGHKLIVVANHWNSKGGDQPLFGRYQPPALSSEAQRNQQATIVRDFVSYALSLDQKANIIVLGDLNDFEFSAPLNTLKSAGLSDLIESLPKNERYTYIFQGNSQALDHILMSDNLAANHNPQLDVVHINAEFADQASDHDPQVARLRFVYQLFLPLGAK